DYPVRESERLGEPRQLRPALTVAAGQHERVATADGAWEQREGADQPRDVLVRVEVADVEDVWRPDGVASFRRRRERRGSELAAQGDRDHADLRGVHVEPRDDLALGIFGVADDRRGAGGAEACRPGDDGLVDGPAATRIVDEVEIVNRQHDRTRSADRALG